MLGKIVDNSYEGVGLDLIGNVNHKRDTKWSRPEMTIERQRVVRGQPKKSGIRSMMGGKDSEIAED